MATVDWLPEMLFAAGIGTAVLVTPPLPFETACSTPPVANSNGGSEQLATAGGNVGRVLTRFRFPGEKSPTVVPAGFALSSFKTFVTVLTPIRSSKDSKLRLSHRPAGPGYR